MREGKRQTTGQGGGGVMNARIVAALAMTSLICWASPCTADDWDAYQRLLGDYYFIDDQPGSRIECRISSPNLDPDGMRAMLKVAEKNIQIVQNINDFKVTYSKGVGFSFIEPVFDVSLKTAEGVADLSLFLKGLDQVNKETAKQIGAIKDLAKATFDDFLRPRRERLRNLKVAVLNEQVIVKYDIDGQESREEYAAGKKRTFGVSSGAPLEAVEEFSLLDGKLAPSKTSASTKLGDTRVTMERSIRYQKLEHFSFPSAIETRTRLESPWNQQDSTILIEFDHCISR
jgi:hypothetical protein